MNQVEHQSMLKQALHANKRVLLKDVKGLNDLPFQAAIEEETKKSSLKALSIGETPTWA